MELFLNILNSLICYRCNKCDLLTYCNIDCKKIHHHDGLINKYFIPIKCISNEFYINYFNDIEHGFFHSISCCYIYFIFNNNKLDEQTVASLLLHDFLKCNNIPQEEHDRKLIEYFPNLLPETYTHSNPPNENNILIKCDRMELRRYSDYKDWVDNRHYSLYNQLNEEQKKNIEIFYNNIRPTLEYFYKNKNEIFIRHGLEKLEKINIHTYFPPNNSFMKVEKISSYPIEIDRPPFGYIKYNTNKQKGFCSNHGGNGTFNKVKGFITYKEFINNKGKIINTEKRDHLYAKSNIPIKKWKFLYQNIDQNDKQKKILENNNIHIISQKILSEFFVFIKLFQDRLIVLNKID